MIRSNVPMPLLFRLRMRANWVARRAQSGLISHRQRSGVEAERAIWARKVAGRSKTAECTPALWTEFVDHYERFTGALCGAAKDGCTVAREHEYASARRWFTRHYASAAPRLRPYLEAEFGKSSEDALQSLLKSTTLLDMLQKDNGDLIPTIARVSEAVYRCDAAFEVGR